MTAQVNFSNEDIEWMARALALARRPFFAPHPNPRVGCVLVAGGVVVGEGWHEIAGEPHAEAHALSMAGARAAGSTAYVTLEPCSHFGRTPPCADALINAGVARVVMAMQDPNPHVAGQGIAKLRAAGIVVDVGLAATEAENLNRGFLRRMRGGRPFVTAKVAMSLDGRTAMASGESQWITGASARQDVQRLRVNSAVILTGIGTVIADDPRLTVRESTDAEAGLRQPLRVVVDSQMRLPANARLLGEPGETLVVTAYSDVAQFAAYMSGDAKVIGLPGLAGRVDLRAMMDELGRRGVNEVLVEAGPVLNGAFLNAGLVDEVVFYIAPKVFGVAANGAFALPGVERLQDAVNLSISDIRAVGADWRVTAVPIYAPTQE